MLKKIYNYVLCKVFFSVLRTFGENWVRLNHLQRVSLGRRRVATHTLHNNGEGRTHQTLIHRDRLHKSFLPHQLLQRITTKLTNL